MAQLILVTHLEVQLVLVAQAQLEIPRFCSGVATLDLQYVGPLTRRLFRHPPGKMSERRTPGGAVRY